MESLVTEEQLQADIQLIQYISAVPTLLDVACRATNMRFAAVARVTEKRWITCSAHDEINFGLKPGDELKVETTLCHEIRQMQQPIIIDNVDEDELYCHHHTPAMYGFKSYISVPIFKKDGSFFGTLCAIDPKPNNLNNSEVRGMFMLFADLISFHLQAIEQLEAGKLSVLKEREEKARMLEQKNEELKKMNAELESFAYIASHDLQEPLRKIKTFSSKLSEVEYETLSPAGKMYFERVLVSVERMQNLIEDLLAYTRVNTHENIFKTFDLKDIVAEIKEDYKNDPNQQNVVIEIGDMCSASVIPFQIHQLFQNIIGNAVKFAKQNEAPVIKISSSIEKGNTLIDKSLSPEKNYCHINISDNGIGFDQQYSDQIFKIFQRLHGRQEYEGTGIGLSIVKKIVDNHKGAITANGKMNEGAAFDIYLPQDYNDELTANEGL